MARPIAGWSGDTAKIARIPEDQHDILLNLATPFFVLSQAGQIGYAAHGKLSESNTLTACLGLVPACAPGQWGAPGFLDTHGVKYAYQCGAMAHGIASTELVIAMGKAGFMASFGAAGLTLDRLGRAIDTVKTALPQGPYAFNFIHMPLDPDMETRVIELYIDKGVTTIEAAAFMRITPALVLYRVSGLQRRPDHTIVAANKIIAKVSRRELAEKFMQPPPEKLVATCLASGHITQEQLNMAKQVPMADDITLEADSGGHTDKRPLISLFPAMVALRQQQAATGRQVRLGAAGGIGTPAAVLAAFMMGADYVVTGSINQACREAGTSETVKQMLAQADMADVMMAPSADMFERGIKVQVLKRGTMFPMRAAKLYELYQAHDSIDDLSATVRDDLERRIFRRDMNTVWDETAAFFQARNPVMLQRALDQPKYKMALLFRWYLGRSVGWAITGNRRRAMDYQIWCGPAMGAFNQWARGSYLEDAQNRSAVDVAHQLLIGAGYQYRAHLAHGLTPHMPRLPHYQPKRWPLNPARNKAET